jgi:beta-lactamase regulating signal transducer with metallopeptidase domain/ketosteroid isomerase-like protein
MSGAFDAAARLLLEGAVRGSLVLLVAASASLALRRSSAAVRHMAWTAGVAGLLLVSPLGRLLPPWPLTVPDPLAPLAQAVLSGGKPALERPLAAVSTTGGSTALAGPAAPPARPPEPTTESVSFAGWFFLLWLAGAAVLAISFLAAALRLTRVIRTSAPVDGAVLERLARAAARDLNVPRDRFRLRSTGHAITPMTWGFWRPVVLLPAACLDWEKERLRPVLIHEIAHVSRGDVFTQALSSLACVVYWFNPLVWWAARQMLIERERACDDRVLGSGAKAFSYAQELLEMARGLGARWTAARVSPAMARRTQVSERLLAVLDPALPRHGATRLSVIASALAAFVIVVPLAAVIPVPAIDAATTVVATPATRPAPAASSHLAPAPEPADMEQARLGVTAAQKAMREAIRRGDAAAAAAVYGEDAVAVAPDVLPIRGRRAIEDALQNMLDKGVIDLEVHRAEMFPVGDKVCELGRATFSISGGGTVTMRFMTLWRREHGGWRILRDYATP